jgi:hypothetical protein
MAWTEVRVVHGGVSATVITSRDPAATPVPASNRGWVAAVNPYSTGKKMAPYIHSEIAFRGDTRDPATIENAGGLWAYQAQAVGTGGTTQQRSPDRHQIGHKDTMYVSTSRDLGVAKGFAAGRYVYVFRVNAGVDYNRFAGGNAYQAEVMAIQGIRLEDIIAVRNLSDGRISVNTNFQPAGMSDLQKNAAITALAR